MARVSILDERVQQLVDHKLIPLFLAAHSTAALCKVLNKTLKANGGGTVHPNRLHALLSDDISRGVNEGTVDLVEQAVQNLHEDEEAWQRRSARRRAELEAEIQHFRTVRQMADDEIAKRLSVPPAVARHLLSLKPSALLAKTDRPSAKAERKFSLETRLPDWGFQDIAIAHCLEAFRQRPASKVGLILPTGAGKTRTALRIVLEKLAKAPTSEGLVYWVTHRKNLRTQAHRELQKLLSADKGQVPGNAAALVANRIKFVMVNALPQILAADAPPPVLVVVDEAHHAAAPSYQPIFEARYPVPALFLTATPNRGDLLPIGIDEIAFTITYRELEERGVIMMPEFQDFPVDDFEWTEEQVRDLADYVIDRAEGEFTKVLVLAPRIERVEEFYDALVEALAQAQGHPLDPDDIGFIHGSGNSLYIDNDDFLDIFAKKPRAILVSAQILLEGFDDPAINTVILTYPSSSLIRLMQAAGRCVRYSPEKNAAYVVQARNDNLAYHFDQRWLYQEISDYLRPELIDIDYATEAELQKKVAELLERHNVKEAARNRILSRVTGLAAGETCRLLLYGLPYFGAVEQFDELSKRGAFLETPANSAAFRGVFNAFSDLGASLSDPSDFLTRDGARFGITRSLTPGSLWTEMMEVLTASHFAREEIYGSNPMAKVSRPSKRHGPTTWLRYATFHFRPQLPLELSDFLADCHNRSDLITAYLDDASCYALAIKFPLPLDGYEGCLLTAVEAAAFETTVNALVTELKKVTAPAQIGVVASFLASSNERLLPSRAFLRIEGFLGAERYTARVLKLPAYRLPQPQGEKL